MTQPATTTTSIPVTTSTPVTVSARGLAQVLAMTWPLADHGDIACLGLDAVHLRIEDGVLIACATDRFVVGWARCTTMSPSAPGWEVLISRRKAKKIARRLSDLFSYSSDHVTLSLAENALFVQTAIRTNGLTWRASARGTEAWPRAILARTARLLLEPTLWDGCGFAVDGPSFARLAALPASSPCVVTPVVMQTGGPLIRVTTPDFVGAYVGTALSTVEPRTYWEDIPDPGAWTSVLTTPGPPGQEAATPDPTGCSPDRVEVAADV